MVLLGWCDKVFTVFPGTTERLRPSKANCGGSFVHHYKWMQIYKRWVGIGRNFMDIGGKGGAMSREKRGLEEKRVSYLFRVV